MLPVNAPAAAIIHPFSVKTCTNSVPADSDLPSIKVKNGSMRLRASGEIAMLGQFVFFRASPIVDDRVHFALSESF